MNAKRNAPALAPIVRCTAAALAGAISIGILAAVTTLFQGVDGSIEAMIAAERACHARAQETSRAACLQPVPSVSGMPSMAKKVGSDSAYPVRLNRS